MENSSDVFFEQLNFTETFDSCGLLSGYEGFQSNCPERLRVWLENHQIKTPVKEVLNGFEYYAVLDRVVVQQEYRRLGHAKKYFYHFLKRLDPRIQFFMGLVEGKMSAKVDFDLLNFYNRYTKVIPGESVIGTLCASSMIELIETCKKLYADHD